MGYGVYEEPGHGRWAGYMVPARCDFPGCDAEIDRGLGWKCEEHPVSEDSVPDGCGLFFCSDHLYETEKHAGVQPKPDTAEWMAWQLVHDSWQRWRDEHPERVAAMRELVTEDDLEKARRTAAAEAEAGEVDGATVLTTLAVLVAIVLIVVGVVFAAKAQAEWEAWCNAEGGRVDSVTSTGYGYTADGKYAQTTDTTYYCLTEDGRVLDVQG